MTGLRTEDRVKLIAELRHFNRVVAVTAACEQPDGRFKVAEPVTWRVVEEGEANVKPMISLHNGEAQLLMDELWRCGLRPSEGAGSAGSLAATERHLKDMQAIAFGLLKGNGVNQ